MEYQAMDQEFGIIELLPPSYYQHLHHLPLLHNLLLPNSHKQANQKGIISCLLNMRTLILSLCGCLRKKMSSQLQHYPVCIWLCAIDCGLPQIPCLLQEYLDQPSFDPDSFVPEEDLHWVGGTDPVFIWPPSLSPVHQSKCLWTGRTLAHPWNQMLRSIVL